jgi:hypothetical protein
MLRLQSPHAFKKFVKYSQGQNGGYGVFIKITWSGFCCEKIIYRYLDCGELHNGFARVKCRLQAVILTSMLNQELLTRR